MAKGSKAAALMPPSQMLLAFPERYTMDDENTSGQQSRSQRPRNLSRQMLATPREVSLAKLLLHLCNIVGAGDRDQEFLELYNEVKPIAEGVLRHGR